MDVQKPPNPVVSSPQLHQPPNHVWTHLMVDQQHHVYQTLVQICQQLALRLSQKENQTDDH